MEIGAVICEYNPFHNGHKHHIEETKKLFNVTHMIAVMSGNFTQRGDVAIFDKWKRTQIALDNGIDLVIELPVAFSLASAEQFAMGAITLLNRLNCVKTVSFGSECGDIGLLSETAGAVHYTMEQEEFKSMMRRGDSYPKALQKAVSHYYEDEVAQVLASPNNTLGIEYIKAINETGSSINPVTIKRHGAAHDSDVSYGGGILSASAIRKRIVSGESVKEYMPDFEYKDYAYINRLELPILSKLRTMTPADLLKVPNIQTGLENRVYKAAKKARSLAELLMFTKTKAYTMARIRRIILNAFLGINKTDLKSLPAYIRILGMNSKGREILSAAQSELPMDTSLMALSETSDNARKQARLESFCGNQYALCFKTPRPCGMDYTMKPIII